MGMNHKPEQRHYWSTDLFYRMPLFPKTMTQGRFDQLSRYLRVVDNEASPSPDDRLWKLRPVIEILQRQFSSVYTHMRIKVDEFQNLQGQGQRRHTCIPDGCRQLDEHHGLKNGMSSIPIIGILPQSDWHSACQSKVHAN